MGGLNGLRSRAILCISKKASQPTTMSCSQSPFNAYGLPLRVVVTPQHECVMICTSDESVDIVAVGHHAWVDVRWPVYASNRHVAKPPRTSPDVVEMDVTIPFHSFSLHLHLLPPSNIASSLPPIALLACHSFNSHSFTHKYIGCTSSTQLFTFSLDSIFNSRSTRTHPHQKHHVHHVHLYQPRRARSPRDLCLRCHHTHVPRFHHCGQSR